MWLFYCFVSLFLEPEIFELCVHIELFKKFSLSSFGLIFLSTSLSDSTAHITCNMLHSKAFAWKLLLGGGATPIQNYFKLNALRIRAQVNIMISPLVISHQTLIRINEKKIRNNKKNYFGKMIQQIEINYFWGQVFQFYNQF